MEETVTQQTQTKKRRFWELDFLRGLCVILMVFDHFMWSAGFMMPSIGQELGTDMWANMQAYTAEVYWFGPLRIWVRFLTLFCFFFICGISCSLSRSNLKRGALCFLVGCGITFFTIIFDKVAAVGSSIYFGVLHMLGIAMMLYGVIDKLGALIAKIGKTDKTKAATKIIGDYLAPAIGLILIIVFFACYFSGIEGDTFGTNVTIEDPQMSILASLFINVNSVVIGGADYWPLLPWIGFVLLGGFVGKGVYSTKAKNYLSKLDGKWNKPVCFVGRHALIVYVAHQVIVFIVLYLITLIFA